MVFLKIISWIIWLIPVASIIAYIPMSKYGLNQSHPSNEIKDVSIVFITCISIIALAESILSLVIKYFALTKPSKLGNFIINTFPGGLRFFIVNFINWIFAESIAIYGVILYFICVDLIARNHATQTIANGSFTLFILYFASSTSNVAN